MCGVRTSPYPHNIRTFKFLKTQLYCYEKRGEPQYKTISFQKQEEETIGSPFTCSSPSPSYLVIHTHSGVSIFSVPLPKSLADNNCEFNNQPFVHETLLVLVRMSMGCLTLSLRL